jgi:uncharacterized protein (DUF697 family)
MNHKFVTLGIAAIIAAVAVTAVGFAVPQQALAHSGHNNNGIKVNQQIDQVNACTNSSFCSNDASNSADIDR